MQVSQPSDIVDDLDDFDCIGDEEWGDDVPQLPPIRTRKKPPKSATMPPSRKSKDSTRVGFMERTLKAPTVMSVAVAVAVAVAVLVAGYFLGRWHLQHQLTTAVTEALQGVLPTTTDNDEKQPFAPAPEFKLGQSHKSELFEVALTRVSMDRMRWSSFDGEHSSKEDLRVCRFDVKNPHDRKVVNFFGRLAVGTPPCSIRDDAGNVVRQVDFPSRSRAEGEGSNEEDIVPGAQSSTVYFFEKPRPKTEYLLVEVNLSTLVNGAEGKLLYKVPMTELNR